MKTIPEGFACVAPIYKDATPKKLSAVSFQPDMAVSIFKDATKFEKVKFGDRVFRGEWVVKGGRGGGWAEKDNWGESEWDRFGGSAPLPPEFIALELKACRRKDRNAFTAYRRSVMNGLI